MEEISILREFLIECGEGVERLDQAFVELEKEPTNKELIGSIFRTIHTIKGTCGFLGLPTLESVSHGAENILSGMREESIAVTEEGITVLLESVDAIKEILESIERIGKEPENRYEDVRQHLEAFLTRSQKEKSPPKAVKKSKPSVKKQKRQGRSGDKKDETEREEKPARPALAPQVSEEKIPPSEIKSMPKMPALSEATIRVDVDLLDRLINMVGELVLARNQLLQQIRGKGGEKLSDANNSTLQQLNLITTELQDKVMKTRMQPIKNVWDKFPRVIRDLARSNQKEIQIVMEGAETELDKTLLEAIRDPLTHVVRNAADHGIELPEERQRKGKPAVGTLRLKAFHEGGQINIEMSDDGAGIDAVRVKEKALEMGVISEETAARMAEREALRLIFHPGLSTAKKVTNVSGRGVGMDVVKTNIEKIGGSIELSSQVGEGTFMRIKIPLTLAIIPALMVASGGEPFAIPQASLVELVHVDRNSDLQIEEINGVDFYRLRGNLLPLISLNKVLHLDGAGLPDANDLEEKGVNIVILKASGIPYGLVVEKVSDSEEIVVKPLSKQLKGLGYLAGATIMGDGRVALIIDALGIAQEGGLLRDSGETRRAEKEEEAVVEEEVKIKKEPMVLFSVGDHDRCAIPLSQVARLEEIESEKIEHSGGFEVTQYRGELLPLIRLADLMGLAPPEIQHSSFSAIVFSRNDRSIGLVVGRIIDIVHAETSFHPSPSGKNGVKGSIVIQGRTTDVLDADQLIDSAVPGWFETAVA